VNSKPEMTVAQAGAKIMKAYDAEHIFTVAGNPLNLLYHAKHDEGIDIVLGRSERSALAMADAYARMTGKPTFGFVQWGPGAAALPAVFAEATWGRSPFICLTGSVVSGTRHLFQYQEIEQLPMMATSTKWSGVLPNPDRIADIMRTAIRASISGNPGPAYLEMPADMYAKKLTKTPDFHADADLAYVNHRRISASPNDIEKIVSHLSGSANPVFVFGGGTVQSSAFDEAAALVKALGIPVVTSVAGKGIVAETDPLAAGVGGRYSRKVANEVLGMSDLVIAVGTRLSAMGTLNYQYPRPGTKIIHIDIDPMSMGNTYVEELAIQADAKLALAALGDAADQAGLSRGNWSDWSSTVESMISEWKEKYRKAAKTKTADGRLNPIFVMSQLDKFVQGDDVMVADTGNMTRWAGTMIDQKQAGLCNLRAAGSLGWSFPAAFGAKVAVGQNRRVLSLNGDGGMGYHIGEIETGLRLDLPVISLVLNNAGFAGYTGLLKNNLGFDPKPTPELSEFVDLDFGQIAKGYGAHGERVEDPGEVEPALRRAVSSGKPAIIDFAVSGNVSAPGMGMQREL
jgi:acetolactate synthase-1/2/3 large subunit